MTSLRIFLFCSIIQFCLIIDGQNIRFDHLDINDGLSQNSAFCMDIDANGYVWTGTLNGLNRYDGYSFEVFKPIINKEGTLKGSLCSAVACDTKGNTWITTRDGGLNKYDISKQKFIFYHDSLFKNFSISYNVDIKIDKKGWIWLNTNRRILGFNPKDSSLFTPLEDKETTHISLLPFGNVCAYGKFGLIEIVHRADSSIDTIQHTKEQINAIGFDKNKVVALHEKSIAIYTDNLLNPEIRYNLSDIKGCPHLKSNPPLLVDSNRVWVGGNPSLIKFEIINDKNIICNQYKYNSDNANSLKGYNISQILKDANGNIWIGTQKHGINFISKQRNKFKHINWKHGNYKNIEIDPVRAICASSKNEYWLGFDRTGLGIIHPTGKQTLITSYIDNTGEEKSLQSVRGIFEDNDKNIWVGLLNGVAIYNRKTNKLEHINRYISGKWNNRTYSIEQFGKHEVAVAVGTRFAIINLANKTYWGYQGKSLPNKLSSNIRDFLTDDNTIWLGLDNSGIVKINTETKETTIFNVDSIGLSNSKVYSISKIKDDLWIATNNGLNRFNTITNKVEEIFYEEDGLSNNIVYSLNSDIHNNLWMSTNRGISKLNTRTSQFSTYLKSDFFMDDASFQDKDGTIYYGGYTGVVYFNPKSLLSEEKTIRPNIESLSLHNNIIKPNIAVNNHTILQQHINNTSSLYFKHNDNTFSFNYNAWPFDIPNSTRYRYKLENWQNNWQEQDGNARKVTFTNVSPGEYKFLLSVTGSNNNWSPAKEITITIEPPFWQKLWFKTMILTLVFILFFAIYRWRVYRIHQRNKLLKQTVEEQTKDIINKSNEIKKISEKLHEADEAKLRFFTNISHEFRTPLTLILGYLDELEDSQSNSVKKVIKNNALRLLRLVNQLIEFRKLDQDQLKLEVSNFEFNAFVGEIIESFQKLAKQKNIALSYEPDASRIPVWLDVDKTEKILFNLISNAIKYTPKDKPIIISTHQNTEHFKIKVTDYGIGISEDELSQIFDRFFRSKNSNESGHGIGLALAKGLVEMQYGQLSVSSEKGKGSVFTAEFNKGRDHFQESEITTEKIEKSFKEENTEVITVANPQTNICDKRILLVEDDGELSSFLQKMLSPTYDITCAENGVDALQKLENIIPDLIISDITMPQMDGITFCKKVKENESNAKIPFILLTAKTDSMTRIEGFKLGIDDYIEKPFNKKVLMARVEALLSNREKLQHAPIETKTIAKIDKSKFSKSDVQFWKKTNTIINRSYGNSNFTTEVLSEKMNMSRSTFYRKFKGLSGENAADYIRKIRLYKATELLQKKELNIQQISLEVGFQSTAHFRTKFKEHFGVNPSEYA